MSNSKKDVWIPPTPVLGTLLFTGYFGGAAVTHIIGGESILPPLMLEAARPKQEYREAV
jgi:hypothetical protein